MYLPLSKRMEILNSAYYKSPSTFIHADFLTYAQSPDGMLPKASAIDFYKRNCPDEEDEEETPCRVLEIGVGEGNFARGFLEELRRQDRAHKTDLSERTTYHLADFSNPMLNRASSNLEKGGFANFATHHFDAASGIIPTSLADLDFHQINCNELFSDLPAAMFVMRGRTISEVLYDEKMNTSLKAHSPSDPLTQALISRLPEGYFVPNNAQAASSALSVAGLLSERGVFDIFDYGFYRADDFAIPQKMWNDNIVREYGTQWTVDLNFIALAAFLASNGYGISVEPQKDFAERVFGQKLSLQSSNSGLSYKKDENNGISEDDSFYHLRAVKLAKKG